MKLSQIVEELNLEIVAGNNKLDLEICDGYVSDILSDVMAKAPRGSLWITNQNHENVIAIVFFKRLSGVIMAGGIEPEEIALKKAIEKEIPLFKTRKNAFDIVGHLFQLGIKGQ